MLKTSTILWCAGGVGVAAALVVTAVLVFSAPKHYGHLVPAETVAYVRIKDVGTFKDRILGEGNLKDPGPIQTEIDRQYQEALVNMAKGFDKVSSDDFDRLAKATGSVHIAVWASLEEPASVDYVDIDSTWLKPQAVLFIEINDADALTELAGKLGDKIEPKQIGDKAGYDLSKLLSTSDPIVGYFMGSVFVVGSETAVLAVMKADSEGLAESLADNPRFNRAFEDWADEGDLFAFVDIQGTAARFQQQYDRQLARVAELPEKNPGRLRPRYINEEPAAAMETDRDGARKQIEDRRKDTMDMFGAAEEYGFAALSVTADGRISARVYAADGKQIPEYMQRTSRVNELTKRIPEDSVFVMVAGYDGGEATRKSFSEYLKEKTGMGISPSKFNIPLSVADQLKNGLEELENEVVMMVDDYWVAVLPVKSEFAVVVAPDAKGAYGAVAVFDWENREQVDKLHDKLFQYAARGELAWQETTHEGLKIRYLDLAEMLPGAKDELGAETTSLLASVQLQLGYAIGDTYCYAGSVDLIKRLHKPTGRSIHEAMSYENVDEENALIWCLNLGAMVHGPKTGIKGVDDFRQALSNQIGADTKYIVTMTATPEHMTLRSNIPVCALAAWLIADKDALTTPLDFGGTSTRDAKRAEGEQIMGSARDYSRVQWAKTGEYQTTIPSEEMQSFEGSYFRVRQRIYRKEGTSMGAMAVDPVGTDSAGYGMMTFNFESGEREIKWFTTRAALDAELEAFEKPAPADD